jgi:peptidoglycan-associated lipoprotein
MRAFSTILTLAGILALVGLTAACAGPQSDQQTAADRVEQETASAAPPGSTPVPASASPESRPAKTDTETVTPDRAGRIKFMYENVYFKRGSTHLDQAAKRLLDKKARWLEAHPDVKVVIEGHTDDRGSKEDNLALGDRRSGAVKSHLMKKGIARERLIAISYGKEKPAVAGRTEKDRAKNRRAHFAIEER